MDFQQKVHNRHDFAFLILLHVEPPQEHDSFVPKESSVDTVRWVDTPVRMDGHDAAAASEPIVQTSKVDSADPVLAEC